MKYIIVNADDLGRAPGVNRGIVDAHRKGIVTSTTVMINLPDAPAGLELAQAQAPHLGVGLHLNLTSGPPVSPPESVASLLDGDGRFVHINRWHAENRALDPAHVQREIEAQFDRYVELTGGPPDHLDSHHHAAFLHPAALRTVLALAAEHSLPLRNVGIDGPPNETAAALRGLIPALTPEAARVLLDTLRAVLDDGPAPRWPARFEGSFYDRGATLGHLLVILTTLPDDSITEIMCHPGYPDETLATSGYIAPREAEIGHLTHAATRECVQSEGIRLVTFGDLPSLSDPGEAP
jgi:chitin disaccharide deacetylase